MSSQSPSSQGARDAAAYGFARVRDVAFDAIRSLWRRRQDEGWKQKDLADRVGRDPAWVSRNLSSPGNWTLRTFGELTEALGGDVEIKIAASEDSGHENFDAYAEFFSKAKPLQNKMMLLHFTGNAVSNIKDVRSPELEPAVRKSIQVHVSEPKTVAAEIVS